MPTRDAGARLGRRFFSTDPGSLAQALLGQRLVRVLDDGTRMAGIIVEAEAYLGAEDRAAHTFGGRRTALNESMYARPGTCYVYFTYGMHHCMNIVCGRVDEPVAVLLRAIEPTEGLGAMRERRGALVAPPDRDLCRGPGRLCRALAIDRSLDGIDLVADGRLFLERARRGTLGPEQVGRGPRIGVGYAGAWAAEPLRWFVRGSPFVSGPAGAAGVERARVRLR